MSNVVDKAILFPWELPTSFFFFAVLLLIKRRSFMVVLSSGIEIWVQVGDARVTEYQVENSKRDLIDTTTCCKLQYIRVYECCWVSFEVVEAKVDREIRVFYKSLVVESKDQEVIVRLYMDGDKISGSHKDYHRGASQEGELSGRIISKDATQRLKFGKLATTGTSHAPAWNLCRLYRFRFGFQSF